MLQFILWYSYHIICAVSRFSFIYVWKLLQNDVKLQTNQYVNSRLLFTNPKKLSISFTSFSFYLAFIAKKYVSTEKRTCFKKDLQVTRDQLPKYYTGNLFPLIISMQKTVKVRLCNLKAKYFKIWQVLFPFFVFCIFNNTTLFERQLWNIWEIFG